jgi:hypothetical protein
LEAEDVAAGFVVREGAADPAAAVQVEEDFVDALGGRAVEAQRDGGVIRAGMVRSSVVAVLPGGGM